MSDEPMDAYRLLIADVYELAGASRRASERAARRRGRTVAEWNVLSVLGQDELSVSATARRLGLARQSVQPVVDRLVDDGLLARRPDSTDARAPLSTATRAGQAALRELWADERPERQAHLDRASVSSEQLRTARETVRLLTAQLREGPH